MHSYHKLLPGQRELMKQKLIDLTYLKCSSATSYAEELTLNIPIIFQKNDYMKKWVAQS